MTIILFKEQHEKTFHDQNFQELYCSPVLLCTFFLCLVRCHLLPYSSLHSVHLYTIFIVPPELELSGTLGSSWEPLLIFFKCFLRLLLVENIHSQWLHLYSSFWLWTLCLWLERSVFVLKSFSQSTHTSFFSSSWVFSWW